MLTFVAYDDEPRPGLGGIPDGSRHRHVRNAQNGGDWAVLFDAENVPATKAGAVLASVADQGAVRFRLAYGDFSRPHLAGWKNAMLTHGVRPVHALTISPGKNTADLALVAGAMKLIYTTDIAGFAIASSDSDFTDLALHLREAGRLVYGYGSRTTLAPFVAACDRFLFIDNLGPGVITPPPAKTRVEPRPKSATPPAAVKSPHPTDDVANGLPDPVAVRLRSIVDAAASADGWDNLAAVCQRMHGELSTLDLTETAKRRPGRYLKSCGLFEVVNRSPGNGKPKVTYLRTKARTKAQRSSD